MFRLRVQGYGIDTGKPATFTALFDDNGKLTNPRSVATSSQFGWGQWQSSKKVPCSFGDCWLCSSAGHGGYILVTQQDQLPPFKDPSRTVDFERNGQHYKFQVFEFEEDCDWAILEYRDDKLRAYSLTKINQSRQVAKLPPYTDEQYRQDIIKTMQRYTPSLLNEEDREEALA
jgi:hypothetical protein